MMFKPKLSSMESLVQIYDTVGTNEFLWRDLPSDIPKGKFAPMKSQKLIEVTETNGQVKTWRITQRGEKWVKWYKENNL